MFPTYLQSRLSTAIAVFLLVTVASGSAFAQAKFVSNAGGAWNSASTWTRVSGSDADGVPDANDSVVVVSPHVVTVGNTVSNCAVLTVNAGAELQLNGTGTLRINAAPGFAAIDGTLTMSSSGTLTETGNGTRSLTIGAGGKMTISSASAAFPSFDAYSFSPSSTVEFTASANQTVQSGITFGNLTLGGSGTKTVAPIPVADTTFRCAGNLTVNSGVTFDVSTNILKIFFSGNVLNEGTIDASVGITVVVMSGSSWVNNGVFLCSTTPGFGYEPTVTFVNTTVGGSSPVTSFFDLIVDGTFTAPANLTVARNVTIKAGAVLNGGAGLRHSVGGNWSNSGTFNASTSTVVFNGSAVQTVGSADFYAVEVRNPAGVQLTGYVNIVSGGNLHLYSGNLSTGSSTLSILATSAAALVLDTNAITGTVNRAIAPGSVEAYHFFSSNSYVIPGGSDNPTSITATVYPSTNAPGLPAPTDTLTTAKRYYALNAAGAGPGFWYTLRLPYAQSEVRGQEARYTLWSNGGAGWYDAGAEAAPDTTSNFVQQSGLTGTTGSWMIGESAAPLPIQVSSFTAAVLSNAAGVGLQWITVSEINSYGFQVQRSALPTGGFVDLAGAFVPGQGNSVEMHKYQWTDASPLAGTSYYRLRKIDRDGSQDYTDPIRVVNDLTMSVGSNGVPARFELAQNYPNPFNPATTIRFSVERPGYTLLKVYTVLGGEVATLFAGQAQPGIDYSVVFDASLLANGAYIYRLTSGEKTTIRKALLVK
jgi:fibronectin-binding autotransporter adhesin